MKLTLRWVSTCIRAQYSSQYSSVFACTLVNRSITSRRIINQSTTNIHNLTVYTNIQVIPLTFSETNIYGSVVYRLFYSFPLTFSETNIYGSIVHRLFQLFPLTYSETTNNHLFWIWRLDKIQVKHSSWHHVLKGRLIVLPKHYFQFSMKR